MSAVGVSLATNTDSNPQGTIVWFTGLSGSGKSTLCIRLAAELRAKGCRCVVLDGDGLRSGLCSDLGFSVEDRAENVRRSMHVAELLAGAADIVLVALITPLQVQRRGVRLYLPQMIEVFVDAPLYICEARDPKGLYKRARRGELAEFTGISSPFEAPVAPDLICRTHEETVRESVARVLLFLSKRQDAVSII